MELREQIRNDAQVQKRRIFRQHWNPFLSDPILTVALWIFGFCHIAGAIFAFPMVRTIAFSIGILYDGYPFWCNFVLIFAVILLILPGVFTLVGLFLQKRYGTIPESECADLRGHRFIHRIFLAVMILCGGAIAFYPAIIISAGEYLVEDQIINLFYLFLAATFVLLFGVILLRPILRKLEENIACIHADRSFLVSYMVLQPFCAILVMNCLPRSIPLWITVGILVAALETIMMRYNHILLTIEKHFDTIDSRVQAQIKSLRDPYDVNEY